MIIFKSAYNNTSKRSTYFSTIFFAITVFLQPLLAVSSPTSFILDK